jgi:multidrug efflux pump subunit AcrA (membrane-fusion protein)
MTLRLVFLLLISFIVAAPAEAQSVRDHTRLSRPAGTAITESQAADLTLTLSAASFRPIQTWVRTAGTIDKTGRILAGSLSGTDASLIRVGQRVRAFPPSSKSSMYQAYVTRIVPSATGVTIEASLVASGRKNSTYYVMEVVTERGPFLSVANEAIIEEGDKHVVYVQQQTGHYVPMQIQTGIQGELYTQVIDGLNEGAQVVTFGSFFIDAEHKLKGTDQIPMSDDRHPH